MGHEPDSPICKLSSGCDATPHVCRVQEAVEAASARGQSAQRDLSELLNLVADLAGVTLTEVRKFLEAADALSRTSRSVRAPKPSVVIAELQETFRRLTQCVFTLRKETERLQRIARTGFGAAGQGSAFEDDNESL